MPQSDPNDYSAYATSAAVHMDGQPFTFGVNGSLQTFKRVQFDDATSASVVDGFYCNLPDVQAGRSLDPRYDTSVGTAGSLLTFTTQTAGLTVHLLSLALPQDGAKALMSRLYTFYDEQLDDNGVTAQLNWIPRFQSGVQVLRLQQDACGFEYVSATYSDTCKIGVPVKLTVYRSTPQPTVFGTSKDLLATSAILQTKLTAARQEMVLALDLLRKQHRRYDTLMDVLSFMLYQWELQKSGEVQTLAAQAQKGATMGDITDATTSGIKPALRAAVKPVAMLGAIAVPATLNLGPRPYAFRLVPSLQKPTFTVVASPDARMTQALTDTTEQYITAPAACPPGAYVTGATLQVDPSHQLSGTPGVHVTVACRDPANTLYVQSSGSGLAPADMAKYRTYRPKTGPDWTTDYPSAELYGFNRNDASKGSPFYKFNASDEDMCFNACARYDTMCKMANYTAANSGNNCHLHGTVGEFADSNSGTVNWVKDGRGVSGVPLASPVASTNKNTSDNSSNN